MTWDVLHHRRQLWLIVAVLLILATYWTAQITDNESDGDGAQTIQMATTLAHQGVVSLDDAPPYRPSMYREPVPVLSNALAIAVIEWFQGRSNTATAYLSGEMARRVKQQNVVWFALLAGLCFGATYLFTSSFYTSLLAPLMMSVPLPLTYSGLSALELDQLDPEATAAVLLTLASLLVAMAARSGRPLVAGLAGVSFGALALTKAVSLYVFLGLLGVLVLGSVLSRRFALPRASALQISLLTAGFCVVVLPWMYRNYQTFGALQIAERGGIVLYTRAVKNGMTAEEYKGAFYVWAPGGASVVGTLLGFRPEDLREGGRLQRLNRGDSTFLERDIAAENAGRPDEVVSYFRKARAEREKIEIELAARSVVNASVEADRRLQDEAVAIIRTYPGDHLLMVFPYLWRGAATTFPVLCLGLVFALARRRTDVAIFILPSLGMVVFYALFSHFIPRYGVTAVPVAIVTALTLLNGLWTRLTLRPAGS